MIDAVLMLMLAHPQVVAEPAPPQPVATPDDGVAALNRAASAAATSGTQRIAEDRAAYSRALADFKDAQARNDAEVAAAAAAAERYRADRAAYENAMGTWRQQVQAVEQANAGRRSPPPKPAPTDRSPVCRTVREKATGSQFETARRVCDR